MADFAQARIFTRIEASDVPLCTLLMQVEE
jgi:hypothetical protein